MKSSDLSFYLETLGCPKNTVDSRTMRINLLQNGFREEKNAKDADLILINTCSFIREAQQNTIETIFDAVKLKGKKDKKIGVVGCFAEQFSGKLEEQIPEVDFFLGTGKFHQISEILKEKFSLQLAPLKPGDFPRLPKSKSIAPYAYFRIAQGCSRKCSFCVIPKIRGSFQGYDLDNIKKQYEEERIQRGDGHLLREAVLVSQDTISTPVEDLRGILAFFQEQESIKWIRLHYLFPDKRVFEILELMKEFPKVVPYLDIPFQHVSARILRAMNRPDDSRLFGEIIERALVLFPEMEIRTSFILGYPGETEEDIEEIIKFMENYPVHKVALFRYSHEENTSSYENSQDDVPDEVKTERINYVREAHLRCRSALRAKLTGKKTFLMLDEINQKEIIARRPQDSPEIDEVVYLPRVQPGTGTEYKVGDIIEGRLDTAMEYDWIGEVV